MTDNMRIWDALKTTDPRHTKEVGFGRKFTSIDAQWQLQRMTEQFGPVGEGWGYTCQHIIESLGESMHIAVADVTIWWLGEHLTPPTQMPAGRPRCSYGPIRGTSELYSPDKSGKMRLDDDAPKKAMTDALTKGLSHLGVSADVFLGMYDDNKYVQKLKAEFAKQEAASGADDDVAVGARRWVSEQNGLLATLTNADDVKAWSVRNAKALKKLQTNFEDEYEKIMRAYGTVLERAQAGL